MRNAIIISIVLIAAGCGSPVTLQTPDNFVLLDDDYGPYDERATSAHGVVMAGRAVDNEQEGSLAFWIDAIKNRLRTMGGYALLEESDVTAATGQRGKLLEFGRDVNGQTYVYWLAVYVTTDDVYLVETGGRQDRFEPVQDQVRQALSGVQLH